MRAFTCLLALTAGCSAPSWSGGTWVDLSHAYDAETLYWPTASGFELRSDAKGMTESGYWYESNTLTTSEHGGTHLDAPVHFAEGKHSTDRIPIERLIGPAAVVDVSVKALADRDYQVRIADFEDWEALNGPIPEGAIVLLHTGYERFWPDAERYLGTAERGLEATFKLSFPGLHPSAAKWLATERNIAAIGIDTASIDHGKSRLFHSHRELFAHDIPVFENVANLDELPWTGAVVIALPMKIRGGSGGPVRIVAHLQ